MTRSFGFGRWFAALLLGMMPLSVLAQPAPAVRPAPQATPAPTPQPPLRSYRPTDEQSALAYRFERKMIAEGAKDQRPIADIRKDADAASQRGDHAAAGRFWLSIALRSGPDAAPWWRYSVVMSNLRGGTYEEREANGSAVYNAALLAYFKAVNRAEEQLALTQIAVYLTSQSEWRGALTAYKAALASREVPAVRTAYLDLLEKRGFRVTNNSVDSDASSPRACFQFSEKLRKGRFDYAPYIRQEAMANPPITVDDEQICVDGLKHGERYTFTIRDGLPSHADIGESLLKPVEVTVYVRDRKPLVRTNGRAYVLPRIGQRGIPLTSVNTAQISLDLMRVGDRALVSTIAAGFPQALDRYDVQRLARETAVPVWKGVLAVENKLNLDVITAFPVDEAVKDLSPGLYLLSARAGSDKPDDDDSGQATQWFVVSDLGLTALKGGDGITGFVHSLGSARGSADVEVRLMARNNDVLSTKKTDANGMVHFEAGLTRGQDALEPAVLVAQAGTDYAFLSLTQPAFDLSDRGVSGREPTGPVDVMLVAERGVYRPGENVQLTALMRNARAQAIASLPLTLIVERPDGVEYRRFVTQDQGLGGRVVSLALGSSAPSGTWRVRAFVDPKRPAVGDTTFLVEDFVPDRLEFTVKHVRDSVRRGEAVEAQIDGRYLFGVPAANLELEGDITVIAATGLPQFPGFVFGLTEETVTSARKSLPDDMKTDANGKFALRGQLPAMPAVSKPLSAVLTVRMAEPGGRAVEREAIIPVLPSSPMLGIKPAFSEDRAKEGEAASFDVMMVSPQGRAVAQTGVRWQLLKVETRFQWYRSGSMWESEAITRTQRVADGRIDVPAAGGAKITAPVAYGRYRLEVSTDDPNGPLTTYAFSAGYVGGGTADTPDVLDVSLDKGDYAVGDTLKLSISPRFAGLATIAIVSDRIVETRTVEVPQGGTSVTLPVGANWGGGAYALVFHRRPLDVAASRQPGRAIGLAWFGIDTKARSLEVTLGTPEKARSRSTLKVPVQIAGLAAGEEARLTLAAVDVGILNLTRYQPPKPEVFYLGKRRLSAEMRDLYGQLIDGMQGTRGAIRSGGDSVAKLAGSPPAQDPVSLFSGLVTVGADGKAEVTFDVPDFNGTLRLMAMAWNGERIGSGTKDVIIRDPVVMTPTLPRFMAVGDQALARLDLTNVEGPPGEYRIAVTGSGEGGLVAGANQMIRLTENGKATVSLPLTGRAPGLTTLDARLTGPGGYESLSHYRLGLRAPFLPVSNREVITLAPGASRVVNATSLAGFLPGTGVISVSASPNAALDVPALLGSLDQYPYGCTEQTVSRALPLLYLSELAADERRLNLSMPPPERLRESIDRVLARQGSSGGFGLWSSQGDDNWITAMSADFLVRARDKGIAVPPLALQSALDRLKNMISQSSDGIGDGGIDLAYAHYVLARTGRGMISDLRFIVDTKLDEVSTALAKAQIGAALALMGDQKRAETAFQAALERLNEDDELGRADYGSNLRDAAAIAALASEGRLPRAIVDRALAKIGEERRRVGTLSTQEKLWMVLAARSLNEAAGSIRIETGNAIASGPFFRTFKADALAQPVTLTNRGTTAVDLAITTGGSPRSAPAAVEAGFTIKRSYFTQDGKPADIAKVPQGTRLVVVLNVTEPDPKSTQVMLHDPLPAGFEIDNPRLVAGGEVQSFPWLPIDPVQPIQSEFRDDRFTAAYTLSGETESFAVAYVVRAVTPGRFQHAGAEVSDMYRPDKMARSAAGTMEVIAP